MKVKESAMKYNTHKFNKDVVDYDSRGWILSNGEILSTNNEPHYTKFGYCDDDDTTIKYNFGYERYICFPMRKFGVTKEQLNTLLHLLDYWFIDGSGVGERSRNIELAFIVDGYNFDIISISPKNYTPDDVIKKIKRYYASGNLYEDLQEDTLSKEETLQLMDDRYGQKELYLWSTYILPNGHFLNPENSIEDFDGQPEYEHCDFYGSEYNAYCDELFEDCVKLNATYPYLYLPKHPTQKQWYAIEEIIDNYDKGLTAICGVDDLFNISAIEDAYDGMSEKEERLINEFERPIAIYTDDIAKIFDASWGGREIVKELKKAISRGGFYESLKEEEETTNNFDSLYDEDGYYNPSQDSRYKNLLRKPINKLSVDDIAYLYTIHMSKYCDGYNSNGTEHTYWYLNNREFEVVYNENVKRFGDRFNKTYEFTSKLKFPLKVYRALRDSEYLNNISGKKQSLSWTTDINIYKKENSIFRKCDRIVEASITSDMIQNEWTILNYIFYSAEPSYGRYPESEITLKPRFKNLKLLDLKFINKDDINEMLKEKKELDERTLYRGESRWNYSNRYDNFAGKFFYGYSWDELSTKPEDEYDKEETEYGFIVKYELDDDAKIYKYISSANYVKDNKLGDIKDKVLTYFVVEAEGLDKSYLGTPLSINDLDEMENNGEAKIFDATDANCWWAMTQYIARKDLEKKGYDGAEWMDEDYLDAHQIQIWNLDKVHKVIKKKKEIKEDKEMDKDSKKEVKTNVDSLGNELSEQQVEYFKNSKVRNKKKELLVVYHGTNIKGLEIFDANGQVGYKFDGKYVNFFTNREDVAKTYADAKTNEGELYSCYLNIEHPYYVKNRVKDSKERTWSTIKDKKTREIRERLAEKFLDNWFGVEVTEEDLDKVNKDLKDFGMFIIKAKDEENGANRMFKSDDENLYNVHRDNRVVSELSCMTLDELFGVEPIEKDTYTDDAWTKALEGRVLKDIDGNWEGQSTNDIVRCILYGNEYKEFKNGDYDGIIIRNVKDSANGDLSIPNSNIYITLKSPNQIKRTDNKNPTDSNKINESKDDINKFIKWAGEDLANKFFKLKDRLQGEEKDIYYWMGLNKQDLAFRLKEVEETPTKKERDKLAKEGSEKIYEDDKWLVLRIDNYEASRRYGKSTKWCISGDRDDCGSRFFDIYTGGLNDIYFYIQKNTPYKYALEFNDIHNWALWNEEDFLDVGEGPLFAEEVKVDGEWHPDIIRQEAPQFPIVKGLPDITKRWNYILTHKEEFADYLDEDLEDSGVYLDKNKFEPFSVGGNDYPDDYLDEKGFRYYGIMVNGINVGNMAVNVSYDDTIVLEGIEIKPKYRKKGYGRTAIELLKKMYSDKKSIELRAVPNSKNFYTKIGFTNDGYNDDSGLYYMSSNINESKQETVKAYHGSQRANIKLSEEPIYLTNDKELAREFAIGYAFNYDLQEEDEPTLYTIEVKFNNPYYIKNEYEYDDLMDIVNIEATKQFLKENNYDGIIYQDEWDSGLIYYMPLNAKKQCKIVDEEILDSYIPERDDAEVEAQQLSTYEAFMNLKGEDDE